MPISSFRFQSTAALAALLMASGLQANEVDQLIIKYRSDVQARMSVAGLQARAVQAVADSTGLNTTYKRAMSPLVGAHVLKLPHAMSVEDAQAYAASIMASHPELDYVEPDRRRYPRAVTPSDPSFGEQWHFKAPGQFAGASNLVNAWGLTKGSPDVVVAVLDSGVTNHADLQANLVGGSSKKSGYDMVSAGEGPNDGGGRDADPSDPGAALGSADNSAWHGTHVAGIIAAVPDNGKGVAGAGWGTRLLAVRILSEQGGSLSDQVDGMLWAAGEPVPGVPDNANPASVLNLSIGTDSYEDCSRTEQDAVTALRKLGVSVVVSAGNENRNVQGSAPANCKGALAVTGVTKDGARVSFANYGSLNAIAAPAVDILSLYNTGTHAPEQDSLHKESGTSQAAPQVAGVLALMLGANPALRDPAVVARPDLPALLESKLKLAARPFPTSIDGSSDPRGCNDNQEIACVCTTETCGAGLLDAFRAVKAVSTPPVARAGANQTVAADAAVTLDGSASKDDAFGGKVASYAWAQLAGETVTLAGADKAKATFTAPHTGQALRFQLTVTDDTGLATKANTLVTVEAGDDGAGSGGSGGGSGGGGSLDWLALVGLASLLLRRRR